MGPSKARQESKLDFGQTKFCFGRIGADSVIAPEGPFKTTPEGWSINRGNHGNALGFHVLEKFQAVGNERD